MAVIAGLVPAISIRQKQRGHISEMAGIFGVKTALTRLLPGHDVRIQALRRP
jgi:hypothetical protein